MQVYLHTYTPACNIAHSYGTRVHVCSRRHTQRSAEAGLGIFRRFTG